jgi:hypothetical protein
MIRLVINKQKLKDAGFFLECSRGGGGGSPPVGSKAEFYSRDKRYSVSVER